MKKIIYAVIKYTVDKGHPDYTCIKNPERELEFTDKYTIDTSKFWGTDDVMDFIKQDMALVAGGGYDTKHIHNVKFSYKC